MDWIDWIDWIDSAPSDTRSLECTHARTNERTNDCGAVGVGVGIEGSHR